ncbi:MAG TPA: histidinol-phosphatase HisJ family protein [Candidatus Dormibacteraeota bacterium]|nr:histidinol-phosphatase HisJ family protein [Candidatus Dormibacteraeota bacterium]
MPLPPDLHVHTEWSWDAPRGHMERSCERALELGLPAIAFTEHADWALVHEGQHPVDIVGYLDAVDRCRSTFKGLRILTGVELGEPHRFERETAELLAAGPIDQVLGSIHSVRIKGELLDASQFRSTVGIDFQEAVREYLRETLRMVESNQRFETLAHLDYPKRYWLDGAAPYREDDYEAEIRAVLKAAARSGRVLEVNTTRGHILCPDLKVVRWWHELGGQAVAFASDAHQPDKIAEGFVVATQMVQAAGFKPAREPMDLWRR